MKLIAISGSWRKINKKLENDIRRVVRKIILQGNGIISGGALNVDFIAVDEVLKLDPTANRLRVFLPTTLEIYTAHYRKRAKEGVITQEQAEQLIAQLIEIKKRNPPSLIENKINKVVNEDVYHERNSTIIEVADELIAFHVNQSGGVQDTIDKAQKRRIPVKVFKYTIK